MGLGLFGHRGRNLQGGLQPLIHTMMSKTHGCCLGPAAECRPVVLLYVVSQWEAQYPLSKLHLASVSHAQYQHREAVAMHVCKLFCHSTQIWFHSCWYWKRLAELPIPECVQRPAGSRSFNDNVKRIKSMIVSCTIVERQNTCGLHTQWICPFKHCCDKHGFKCNRRQSSQWNSEKSNHIFLDGKGCHINISFWI